METSSSPPSSPLSSLSRSPSPPPDYPSPPASHDSGESRSSQKREEPEAGDGDGSPPAKRQKIMKPKELKTEYLNLKALHESSDAIHHKEQDQKLKRLLDALRTKRKIVVIAGAGISVSAGIPDFRSSTGLFRNLRTQHNLKSSGKHLFDASVYRNDSSTSSFHAMVRELSQKTQNAKPTPFHHMLATLAEEGRLLRLYTQNVDGIDTALKPLATNVPLNPKGPWPKTIQLHGGLEKMVCTKCGKLSDFDGSMFEGPEPPSCSECEDNDAVRVAAGLRSHGIGRLRPRMVLYNEYNPDEDAIGNVSHADLRTRPDAVIVVGTSLKVPGIRRLAREMCQVTRGKRGGFTAWINHDPEPIGIDVKDCWDMVVRGECDDVARLVNLPNWNDPGHEEFKLVEGDEGVKKVQVEVVVDSKPISAVKTQGILTPADSPRDQSPTPTIVKLKQQPLSFAGVTKPSTTTTEAKKKAGRKPLPSKPIPSASKITNSFATSKLTKPSEKSASKATPATPTHVPSRHPSTVLFPGLASDPMRPVSPFDTRTNSEPSPYATPKSSYPVVEVQPYVPSYKRDDTISPKGAIPSGMKDLLSS